MTGVTQSVFSYLVLCALNIEMTGVSQNLFYTTTLSGLSITFFEKHEHLDHG